MNQAISQTGFYAMANAIRFLTSIIMLPIYMRYLTPEDYGVIELMTMSLDFVAVIICSRIGESIFRYYSSASSEEEKNKTMSTAFFLGAGLNGIGFLLLLLFSSPISSFISNDANFQSLFILFAVTIIFEALVNIPIIFLRLQNFARFYLVVSVIRLLVQVSLNVYFVVIQDLHVAGVVYSSLISNILLGTVLCVYLISKVGIHFSADITKKLVVFSLPLILVSVSSFLTTFGDRYFLKLYGSIEDVGLYSLAYKFGFIFVSLSWGPFFDYWEGARYKLADKAEDFPKYERTFFYVNVYIITFATALNCLIPELIMILASESFYEAAQYVPYIVYAFVFYAWSYYSNFGIFLREKTKYLAVIEVFSAAVILLLYVFLIQRYGILGACISTLAGYFLRFILTYALARKYFDMKLQWRRVSLLFLISVAVYLCSTQINFGLFTSILLKMLLLFAYVIGVYKLPIWHESERFELRETCLKALEKLRNTLPGSVR